MLDVVFLDSAAERTQGLQGMKEIPKRTLFVFPNTQQGGYFHSQNVVEPFELFFLDPNFKVIEAWRVKPPNGKVNIPAGSAMAVEAKDGTFYQLGYDHLEAAIREAVRQSRV